MDKVNIPGEAPGSATWYMGFAPDEYGTRLYEMEQHGDVVIREAFMDIGVQRTEPHEELFSSKEYDNLVWKSKGKIIFSCRFEITYEDIDITVIPDFERKTLTLQVDPAINQQQKIRLADFFNILTEPDYYDKKELDEIAEELDVPVSFGAIKIAGIVILIIVATLIYLDVLPGGGIIEKILDVFSWLFRLL